MKKFSDDKASDLFLDILNDDYCIGPCWWMCEFCGRVYFNDECENIEELRENAKKEPDKYIEVDYSISAAHLAGKQYFIGCECNAATNYENFIWLNRELIAKYLTARCAERLRAAQKDMEVVKKIPLKQVSEFYIENQEG